MGEKPRAAMTEVAVGGVSAGVPRWRRPPRLLPRAQAAPWQPHDDAQAPGLRLTAMLPLMMSCISLSAGAYRPALPIPRRSPNATTFAVPKHQAQRRPRSIRIRCMKEILTSTLSRSPSSTIVHTTPASSRWSSCFRSWAAAARPSVSWRVPWRATTWPRFMSGAT